MPELPEVETVRRGLQPVMEARRILRLELNRKDLRFPFPDRFQQRLEGAEVLRLGRRAKFLTAELSTGENLIMHLGMSGRYTIGSVRAHKAPLQPGAFAHQIEDSHKHDHVVFHMEGGTRITYNDPRRFGFMEIWPFTDMSDYPRFKNLGPEPLSNTFHAEYLDRKLAGRASSIKAALLDQSVIAGLGNIYVCEALFRAGISPRRTAKTVSGARAIRLVPAINDVIYEAIEAGGSSISDYAQANGDLGYFQHRFSVYDRAGEMCVNCGSEIRRLVQSARSSFYCGTCQR